MRRLVAVIALSAVPLLSHTTANADIIIPGDPALLGDVQVVTDISVPPEPDPAKSCTLEAAAPYVERDPGSGSFRNAGDGTAQCNTGTIYMTLAVELHYYTSPTGGGAAIVGTRGTDAGYTLTSAHASWRSNQAGYLRTIAQSRYTFPKPATSYQLGNGCARTGAYTATCNAASRAVASGPSVLP